MVPILLPIADGSGNAVVDFQRTQANALLTTFDTTLSNGVFEVYVQPTLDLMAAAAAVPAGSFSADLNTNDAVIAISNPRTPTSDDGLSAGQIAGAAVGAVAGVALIGAAIALSMKKKKRGVEDADAPGNGASAQVEGGGTSGV